MAAYPQEQDKFILQGREELKNQFRNGSMPSQIEFSNLIDSTINRLDDGFSKDEEYGLMLSPSGANKKLISFYEKIDEPSPLFFIEKGEADAPGINISAAERETSLFLNKDGKVGVGTSTPAYRLDVHGYAAMAGRIGNYKTGKVPADGKWYVVLDELDNCLGFEVVARAGKKGSGKFAVTHATALCVYGKGRVRQTNTYYGFFWNKIKLRWKGSAHKYRLEIRTNSNYGKDADIHYALTQLWDDTLFLAKDEMYTQDKS